MKEINKFLNYHYLLPDLAPWLTFSGSNYPCLEQFSMVPKMFEPLKFDCIRDWLYNMSYINLNQLIVRSDKTWHQGLGASLSYGETLFPLKVDTKGKVANTFRQNDLPWAVSIHLKRMVAQCSEARGSGLGPRSDAMIVLGTNISITA